MQRHVAGIVISVVIAVIFATGPPWWWHYLSRASTGTSTGRVTGTAGPRSASTAGSWTGLPSGSWRTFGIARVVPEPHGVMRVIFGQRLTAANKWAGIISNIPRSCAYSIRMQARVVSLPGSQGGYGISSGTLNARSLPEGTAFQYDFGFGGYRGLDYPDDWEQPYQYVDASLDHRWHNIYVSFGNKMTAHVDRRMILSRPSLDACGVPIIRVWSATVEVRDVEIRSTTS